MLPNREGKVITTDQVKITVFLISVVLDGDYLSPNFIK